jgi:hypothetical protein
MNPMDNIIKIRKKIDSPRPALGGVLFCAASVLLPGAALASCGSAFCVIDTNWATQEAATEAGAARLDLRYEYINQDKLRSGSKAISQAEDTSDTTELRTVNRNLVTTFDYSFSSAWAVSVSAPVVQRDHSHIVDPTGAATFEEWKFTELGDARALGYYRLTDKDDPLKRYGFIFGAKLPTGDYRVTNADGVAAERALQPGTGSTDLILGAYHSSAALSSGASWFVQGQVQQAVATRDGFKPGTQYLLNLGYRYPVTHAFSARIQLNTLVKDRDSGVNSEPDLSGSKTIYVSPGLSYAIGHDIEVYAFVQLPVYRYYNGVQLTADRAFAGGATFRF